MDAFMAGNVSLTSFKCFLPGVLLIFLQIMTIRKSCKVSLENENVSIDHDKSVNDVLMTHLLITT